MTMLRLFVLIMLIAPWLVPCTAAAAPKKATPAPAPATDKAPASATGTAQTVSKADLEKLLLFGKCYVECKQKISNGVIVRAEGMACMDLCVDDVLNVSRAATHVMGRVYIKYADGKIEKALKIPVFILSMDATPENPPAGLEDKKKAAIDLINKALESKKGVACASASDYASCGYGLESTLRQFVVSSGYTDIDNGTFVSDGLPVGTYVIWVDWFQSSAQDWNVGNLYRWMIPFRPTEQNRINLELNEENISFIMLNFPRAEFKQ